MIAALVRTLFFGSGSFAVPILEATRQLSPLEVVGIVSVPDRPAGRGARLTAPPVVERARELGLPVLQPASLRDPGVIEAIRGLRPDLAVLADYGRLVPPAVLAIPARGFLNLHPSLLPRHRGATPIQATILAGDPRAGVSLFAMDAGLDTGPVIAQASWSLAGDETAPELEAAAAERAAALLRDRLPGWLAGHDEARPQDDAGMTLTRPLRRADGRLDPGRPARELERRVRALQPWPGAFLETGDGRFTVLAATPEAAEAGDVPGRLEAAGRGIALATVDGRLRLDRVIPAGGRPMTGEELVRGRPRLVGAATRAGG